MQFRLNLLQQSFLFYLSFDIQLLCNIEIKWSVYINGFYIRGYYELWMLANDISVLYQVCTSHYSYSKIQGYHIGQVL